MTDNELLTEIRRVADALERIAARTAPTPPLTYTLPEASARLGEAFTVDWLKHHLAELPHIRAGRGRGRAGRVAFTEAHLVQIIAKHTNDPIEIPEPEFKGVLSRPRRRMA